MSWFGRAAYGTGVILFLAATAPDFAALIAARRKHMAELNAAMMVLGREIANGHPDRKVALSRADSIHNIAHGIPAWSPEGSDIESGEATLALPEIWLKPDDFKAKVAALAAAAEALQALGDRTTCTPSLPTPTQSIGLACLSQAVPAFRLTAANYGTDLDDKSPPFRTSRSGPRSVSIRNGPSRLRR